MYEWKKKKEFEVGGFYHIYNHGTEKRNIFDDQGNLDRFFKSMVEFNEVDPIGSLYLNTIISKRSQNKVSIPVNSPVLPSKNLVNIIAYCLNPNHFHMILEEREQGGISEYMRRLCGGYTRYFNLKVKRRGHIFEGGFKSKHIDKDGYLLHASAYVNLNDKVHKLDQFSEKLNLIKASLVGANILEKRREFARKILFMSLLAALRHTRNLRNMLSKIFWL